MDNELSTSTKTPLPARWGQRLIDRMKLEYGQKFANQWPGIAEDKLCAHWASELAGFSAEDLRRGIDAMKASAWPPTLPEFRALCKPALDPQKAYDEAVAGLQQRLRGEVGTWSHPAIFWASSKLAFDIRHQTYQALKSRWEHALNAELAIGSWSEIPSPAEAEPALQIAYTREEKTAAAELMRQAIAKSGAVKSMDDENINFRAWAVKIRGDWQKKGKKYPWISYKMADEVLNFLPKSES